MFSQASSQEIREYEEAQRHEYPMRENGLIYAVENGVLKAVEFYVKLKNADVNRVRNIHWNYDRWTALHWVAYDDSLEVAKMLINKGADKNDNNCFRNTIPLDLAKERDNTKMISYLKSLK